MSAKKWIGGALLGILLIGCTASGPPFPGFEKPPEGMAQMYIYRFTREICASAVDMEIALDQKVVGEFSSWGYTLARMEPGDHHLRIGPEGDWREEMTVPLQPGETKFLKYTTRCPPSWRPEDAGTLEVMDAQTALSELPKYSYQPLAANTSPARN